MLGLKVLLALADQEKKIKVPSTHIELIKNNRTKLQLQKRGKKFDSQSLLMVAVAVSTMYTSFYHRCSLLFYKMSRFPKS